MDDNSVAEAGARALEMLPENQAPARKNIFETPCKDCVFAVYQGSSQTGCAFDRLEKFRKQGIEVVDAYDDDKEFFVVQTACRAHRHKKSPWAMRHSGRERAAVCRSELNLDVEVVLVMGDDHTPEQAEATVKSLLAQTMLPSKATVVVNRDGLKPNDIRVFLPGDWIAKFIMERNADGSRIHAGRCIDHAVFGSTAHFYAVFTPGFVVPPDFVAAIDRAVNDDLERFVLLDPTPAGEGQVVQMHAHHYFGGNAEAEICGEDAGDEAGQRADTIADKIRHRVRVEEAGHLIRKVVDVCPSLA